MLESDDASHFLIAQDSCSGVILPAAPTPGGPFASCSIEVTYNDPSSSIPPGTISRDAILTVFQAQGLGHSRSVQLRGMTMRTDVQPTILAPDEGFNFGDVAIGSASPFRTFTLVNRTAGVQLLDTAWATSFTHFEIASNNCTGFLSPGARCTFGAAFQPHDAGVIGELRALSMSSGPFNFIASLELFGNAVSQSPASIVVTGGTAANAVSFPATRVGTESAPVFVTIRNEGQALSSNVAFTLTDTANFGLDLAGCRTAGGGSLYLAGGEQCQIAAVFRPQQGGKTSTAGLAVSGGPVIQLSGTSFGGAGGATTGAWSKVKDGPSPGISGVHRLEVLPTNPRRLLLSYRDPRDPSSGDTLLLEDTATPEWKALLIGSAGSVAVDQRVHPNVYYGRTRFPANETVPFLQATTDPFGGAPWLDRGRANGVFFSALTIDPVVPGPTLFSLGQKSASSLASLWESNDGGQTWLELSPNPPQVGFLNLWHSRADGAFFARAVQPDTLITPGMADGRDTVGLRLWRHSQTGPLPANARIEQGALRPVCTHTIDGVQLFSAPGDTFPMGPSQVDCTVEDAFGNKTSGQFTITVADTQPPRLYLPDNQTVTAAAGETTAVVTFDTPRAEDLVDDAVPVTCTSGPEQVVNSGDSFPIGRTFVSCVAQDKAGNIAQGGFLITVVGDGEPTPGTPTLTVPADVTLEATEARGAEYSFVASAIGGAGDTLDVTCSRLSIYPLGTTRIECAALDGATRLVDSFLITVVDTRPPVVTVPADRTVPAEGSWGADVSGISATAHDVVDGDLPAICTPGSGRFPTGVATQVICRATDHAGNVGEGRFTVTVTDHRPPVLAGITDRKVAATDRFGAVVTSYDVTAYDPEDGACGPTASCTLECTPAAGTFFQLGLSTVVTCRARDSSGNDSVGSFRISVADEEPPLLTVPFYFRQEASEPAGAHVTFAASAFDLVDGNVTPACERSRGVAEAGTGGAQPVAAGDLFPLGLTDVRCRATDAAGNTTIKEFTVEVVDRTAPTLTLAPLANPIPAASANGAALVISGTANDTVNGSIPISCTPPIGATLPLGDTEITCTARDQSGNVASQTFVAHVADTTAPVVTVPTSIEARATDPAGVVVSFQDKVSALDQVDGPLTPICDPPSGSTFKVGPTTVTCSATDQAGKKGTATFIVNVTTNPDGPSLTLPGPFTVEATGPNGAAVNYVPAPTAHDATDGDITPVCNPISGSTFGLGSHSVNCTATDNDTNSTSGIISVTVQDTTAPNLIGVPGPIVAEATSSAGAMVTYPMPTAHDLVDGDRPVDCQPSSGSTFPLGINTVTCTASDTRAHQAAKSFTVTVKDETPPTIIAAAAPTEATSPAGARVVFPATANDLVDGAVPVTCSPLSSGDIFPIAITTITCKATDSHLNTSTIPVAVPVVDTTAPVVTVPGTITVTATEAGGARVPFTVTATDATTPNLTPTCSRPSGDLFKVGATTVTCTATDNYTNKGTASFDIVVQPNPAPVVTAPANQSGGEGQAVSFATGSFSDAAGDGPWTVSINWGDGTATTTFAASATGSLPAKTHTFVEQGAYTVKVSVTDRFGGVGSATFRADVANAAPVVGTITGPITPQAIGTSISISAAFTDDGRADTHTCKLNWDDGVTTTGKVTESNGQGTCTGSHSYSVMGGYLVEVTITDDELAAGTGTLLVVITDSAAFFAAGIGAVDTPAGGYKANSALTGKGRFAFVAGSRSGPPVGRTYFDFKPASLVFRSTSYDSIEFSGAKAQVKGSGTVNGASGYAFILSVTDGDLSGGGGKDRFRMKISKKSGGTVVYDNLPGATDTLSGFTPPLTNPGLVVIRKR